MAVDTQREEYADMMVEVARVRDAIAGQTAMQHNAKVYVRRPEGMGDTEWVSYVGGTTFYDATSRTVEGLTGMAFADDPIVTVPKSLEAIRDDLTMDALSVYGFAEALFEEVLVAARAGVLVDYPKPDESVRTRRDEEAANRRPFAVLYRTEQIFYWRTARIRGRRQTVEVRLHETRDVQDDEFEWRSIARIRVLELVEAGVAYAYRQRVFELDGTNTWKQVDAYTPVMDGQPLAYIPFWFVNPRDLTDAMVKPPLLGLANANIAHFNTGARLDNALSFCGSPQPYITGHDAGTDESFTIGSSEAWCLPEENAKVGYLTVGTDGVSALERRLAVFEQHMAMLGARMLSPDRKGVEAAETAQIHRQGEVSVVKSACNRTSEALTEVLLFMAEWSGSPATRETVAFAIQTAFFEQPMTPAEAETLMKVWQGNVIAYADLLQAYKRGKLVGAERTEEAIAAENQSGLITPGLGSLTGPGTGDGA